MESKYTLGCDNCNNIYFSEEGFPNPQFCPKCLNAFKAGRDSIVSELKVLDNPGDYLDLEVEAEYACSEGGVIHTVSVDKLLQAQVIADKKAWEGR